MLIKRDLAEPGEPEINRILKLFLFLRFIVQKDFVDDALSRMSTVRILKIDLKLFPYYIQVKQKLTAQDEQTQVAIYNWFSDKMEEDDHWINNVWFSDEAHFHLDSYVKSKNCVFWGTGSPQKVLQQPLHSS